MPYQPPVPYRQPYPPRPQPRPRPAPSGTSTAALVIAAVSIPAYVLGLLWIPAVLVFGGYLAPAIVAAPGLLPLVLGSVALREVRQGRAHPVSRPRAILGMLISVCELLIVAAGVAVWLFDPSR